MLASPVLSSLISVYFAAELACRVFERGGFQSYASSQEIQGRIRRRGNTTKSIGYCAKRMRINEGHCQSSRRTRYLPQRRVFCLSLDTRLFAMVGVPRRMSESAGL